MDCKIEDVPVFSVYDIPLPEQEQLLLHARAQLKQDIFVYLESGRKRGGFFVEFGASDGLTLSNSYMLEQQFNWRGILAEPSNYWHQELRDNRPNTTIETDCVWSETGKELEFSNVEDVGELSTLAAFASSDQHANIRNSSSTITKVQTISLYDMLEKHHAPAIIDYLSIDTEGSEYEILEAFFAENNKYEFSIITCEHNYTDTRNKIYDLLSNKGYVRVHSAITAWDDFYVLKKPH